MAPRKGTKVALAKKLGVSRSSLYYKPKKPSSDEERRRKIIAVMEEHPAYGSRRVGWALQLNRKGVRRLMRKFRLKPKLRRGFRLVKPNDLGRPESRVENIAKILCPIRANVLWAGDFTYFWFLERFWYVATVIDVYAREIVGWHLGSHHTTALIIEAFKDGVRRAQASPTYFHSDQGSEYVSGAYESLLAEHKTIPSHSRKSSPWQNGYQESFYNNFKLELSDVRRFKDAGELMEAVSQQIAYYNTRRIHSALRMPPKIFRETQQQKQLAYASL